MRSLALGRLHRVLDGAVNFRLLERATLVYLVLPFLIFVVGWLRPVIAVPVVAVVILGFVFAQRELSAGPDDEAEREQRTPRITVGTLLLWLVLIFVAVYSGSGAYSVQDSDQLRANAFLADLSQYSWPLAYEHTGARGERGVLAFYLANALPAALVGSLLGVNAAFHASFVWTVVGLAIAVFWFVRISGWSSPWIGILFLFFGGLDILGQGLITGSWSVGLGNSQLDIWLAQYAWENYDLMGGMFWGFPSNMTMLFIGPHHVLATWSGLFMIADDASRRGTCRRAGFLAAPLLFWSAFGFVGVAPFLLVVLVVSRGRGFFSFENLVAGPLILLVIGLYLLSNSQDYIRGPLWEFQDPVEIASLLALVCLLEFGLYALLFPPTGRRGQRGLQPLWWFALVLCLLAAPWYRMGLFSDFPTKFTIASLAVLQVWLAQSVAPSGRPVASIRTWVLTCVFAVGAVGSVGMLSRAVSQGLTFAPVRAGSMLHANQLAPKKLGDQLFSDGSGFFWRTLARPVEYQDIPIAVRSFQRHPRGLVLPRLSREALEHQRHLQQRRRSQ